jgi:hypothetical protein
MQEVNAQMEALEQALDQTYASLRSGDFSKLPGLIEATETGLASVAGLADVAMIKRLQRLADRNARCLQAAAKGMRAARRRVTEVMAARAGLKTYNGQGQTHRIGPQTGTLKARF